jgi:dTDP-4-dehydrorhamnose 3,5-epimerase
MNSELPAVPDRQTVTSEGEPVQSLIDGVKVRPAVTHPDERGDLCELYSTAWGFDDDPMVYAYFASVRPGQTKGWVKHLLQTDRLFMATGSFRVVLYDDRPDSPTYQKLNVLYFSDRKRGLVRIPAGVFHAVQNVGHVDASFVNCPTRAYNHAQPDKYRLPLDTPLIPFSFVPKLGG